jgi:hypothetical protein
VNKPIEALEVAILIASAITVLTALLWCLAELGA